MQVSYNEFFFKVDAPYTAAFIELIFALGVDAVEEKNGGVFVRSNEDLSAVVWAVDEFSERLSQIKNIKLNLRKKFSTKPNKDWILEYKKGVQPLQIGDFYIHSSWQEPNKGLINVQIDPALAFGSGHHESTHTCIELLQKFAAKGDEVLDVGCGSGILSIVLAKMGCVVSACDSDEIAVSSALSNAKLNGVKFKEIWQGSVNSALRENLAENSACKKSKKARENSLNLKENSQILSENLGNLKENSQNLENSAEFSPNLAKNSANLAKNLENSAKISSPKGYDLVVANLVGDVILNLANDLKQSVKNKGFLILSGIVERYEKRIENAFKDFKQVHKIQANEWLSFVYKKEV